MEKEQRSYLLRKEKGKLVVYVIPNDDEVKKKNNSQNGK